MLIITDEGNYVPVSKSVYIGPVNTSKVAKPKAQGEGGPAVPEKVRYSFYFGAGGFTFRSGFFNTLDDAETVHKSILTEMEG